ncbi:hypothetical protein [Thioclava sp. DLFJ4-1]|uniref:hypothetical protein n=1 Tax=Thioclava sp. DLFJ4-1 TaxID=1915313 RepID=UPI000998DB9D|nr:hypothetical protein [Thioclava sp. DLFJ4-1]OOY15097.1 hypothetical protein BMI85_16250 [Thioclava sp. DLFJ4-1]
MAKTEDEIAREKEQVQKMIGAKGAMEAAIKRIERLEKAISHAECILSDMRGKVGEGLYVKTFYHGRTIGDGEQTISLRDQISYAQSVLEDVK